MIDLNNRKQGALSRRGLITGAFAAAGSSLLLPRVASASIASSVCIPTGGSGGYAPYDDAYDETYDDVPMDGPGSRTVRLYNPRTGENYEETYVVDGEYVPAALERYNWFSRDWRVDEQRVMDPGILDIIWKVSQVLGATAPWSVTSAYRSPTTNASVGGAKTSYHMRGKANDLVHPQKSPAAVYAAAMQAAAGGVGRYNSFTHVDTGPKRTWG